MTSTEARIAELAADLAANGWDELDALYEARKAVADQDSRAETDAA